MSQSQFKPDAIVLCGGEGRRMGGADKALLNLGEHPLIARVLAAITPQVGQIILCAKRSLDRYQAFACPVVVDEAAFGAAGPLAGMLAGFEKAQHEWILCVPGDAPLLPVDLAWRLAASCAAESADIAVVHDGGGLQPLCALLPRALATELRVYLAQGGRSAREWYGRYHLALCDFSSHPRWAWSLNTPHEWHSAEKQLAGESLQS